jgi:hypothetical protein
VWVTFVYDAELGCQGFRSGNQVEIPDETARRWTLMFELFRTQQIEMGNWKSRSWRPETRALPENLLWLVAPDAPEAESPSASARPHA